jgi:hypothetical protein
MRILIAFFVLLSFQIFPAQAPAQQRTVPNVESCTQWREQGGNLYTSNTCDQTVSVQFMTLDGTLRITRTIERNREFDTKLSREKAREIGWIASTCPVGYRPTIELTASNRQQFFDSNYECIRN